MSEFFQSSFFILLLAQVASFLCERYIDVYIMRRDVSQYSVIYNFHTIVTLLIFIITTISCCIKYSWWLIVVAPLSIFFASTIISAIVNVCVFRHLGWNSSRLLSFICTVLLNTTLVYMWFR